MNPMDKLPLWARTSTTGQGIAGMLAVAVATAASHYTSNTDLLGAIAVLTGAVALILFPQSTAGAVPPASVAVATDLETALSMIRLGHSLAATKVVAPVPQAATVTAPTITTTETPHA